MKNTEPRTRLCLTHTNASLLTQKLSTTTNSYERMEFAGPRAGQDESTCGDVLWYEMTSQLAGGRPDDVTASRRPAKHRRDDAMYRDVADRKTNLQRISNNRRHGQEVKTRENSEMTRAHTHTASLVSDADTPERRVHEGRKRNGSEDDERG